SPQLQTGELVWDVPHEENPKGFWPLPKREKAKFAHRYGYYECRCAERNEVFVLTSHGIAPDAKGINMKTEWLERILATAKESGVAVIGFDEL
ncbi:MAG: hypothetical protein J6M06_01200, partial [Synergistaceae bacterium]|nr:hypothetical protein [Synergistaceae bacterium]